jgi:ABC-type multidrug transport system ATPase subunit
MLILTVALYGFLAWWLENVWQGEFGKAKPLNFCCNPAYMCQRRRHSEAVPQSNGDSTQVAMSIQHLRKQFKDKVAVDDMTFDVYGGEIFALLGHNGAGKTTAINCIIGLIPPTSGCAIVNGFSSETSVEAARRQLSICPQDNPFYDVFTVRQHLVFFAKLRGTSEERVTHRLMAVLSALGMPEKVDELCKTLSGGQKRRLWVATALIGESPIMFLDEPTSGMDPSSRREWWDMFLQMKSIGS